MLTEQNYRYGLDAKEQVEQRRCVARVKFIKKQEFLDSPFPPAIELPESGNARLHSKFCPAVMKLRRAALDNAEVGETEWTRTNKGHFTHDYIQQLG